MTPRLLLCVIPLTFALFACGPSRSRGNDQTIAPAVPWAEFSSQRGFTVELGRPAHIAVLHVAGDGKKTIDLVYVDSAGTPPAERYDVALSGAAPALPAAPQQRIVKRCMEGPPGAFRNDSLYYRWACAWRIEDVPQHSRNAAGACNCRENFYVVVAYETPRSTEQVRQSLSRIDANLPLETLVDAFARDLLADVPAARWAARLQFVP